LETQRLFLFFLFLFLLFLLWQAWQRDYGPEGREEAPAATEAAPPGPARIPELPAEARPPAGAEEAEAALAEPARRVEIRTDVLALEIDPRGAAIRSVRLLQYPVELDGAENFALIDGSRSNLLSVRGGILSAQSSVRLPREDDLFVAAEENYSLEGESMEVRLRWSGNREGELQVDKVFLLRRGSYVVHVFYEIRNSGEASWKGRTYMQFRYRESDSGIDIASGGYAGYQGIALSSPDKRYRKIDFSDIQKKKLAEDIANGWIAYLQRYFLTAVLPADPQGEYRYYTLSPVAEQYIAGSIAPPLQVAPGESKTAGHHLYLGPKLQRILAETAPGLELTLDYGWLWFVAKVLFVVLIWLQGFTGNWGVSIILLTLLVKILFYRLSATSYRSMARMRKLQPRMMALKERYGNDRQRMHQAVMQLYREEKVNPLGGCLPIVVQIPVFIALYWVLLESVELRQAEFAFWVRDLSSRDPYFVLPVVMGITMYLQQKLNPPIADPVQQRIINFLPLIFTGLFAFFPSGLVLYWLVNNTLSLLQQRYVYARIEKETAAGAAG